MKTPKKAAHLALALVATFSAPAWSDFCEGRDDGYYEVHYVYGKCGSYTNYGAICVDEETIDAWIISYWIAPPCQLA